MLARQIVGPRIHTPKPRAVQVTFPTIQFKDGEFMNEAFDLMKRLTKEYDVDNSKLTAWKYLTTHIDEGTAGPSLMQRYFYMLGFCKETFGGLDQVKAELFAGDRKIPSMVPPDIDAW